MSVIEVKDLALSYEGREIFSNLSFEIGGGDYLCIVGENGSGKTSLMKTLLGLRRPDAGEIRFGCGCEVDHPGEHGCRADHKIGYLPQQTNYQRDFPASVWEIVLSGTLSKGHPFYTKADKERATQMMERLGITEYKKESYMNLSGGQQQRVLLARALCAAEDILFLDEPVSGLDPLVTREMYDLVNQLNKDGLTIVMISHDIESAINYSKHVLHLNRKIEFFGTTEDYKKTELYEH